MKVHELIAQLARCPHDADVVFFSDWDDVRPVHDLSQEDSDGRVVLGRVLPPEVYARDYKDD